MKEKQNKCNIKIRKKYNISEVTLNFKLIEQNLEKHITTRLTSL